MAGIQRLLSSFVRFIAVLALFATPICLHGQAAIESDEAVMTQHTVTPNGMPLHYTARTGYLSLRDEQNQVHGRIFYVSYTMESSEPRPLIFIWNGGPGSNAALLELGAIGPRRIRQKDETVKGNPTLVDNGDTWLRFADLVFVDPIFTGYSYATTPEFQKDFLSDTGDAESIAEFIRLFRARYQTQVAPLYLMGESYGTYRAVGVADILLRRKIPVSGILLLSTVLNFTSNPDLSAAFLLPNYAAAAFAQHKLDDAHQKDLAATVAEAQAWAETTYVADLIQGDRLLEAEKKAAATKLAALTGVDSELWEKADLRLSPDAFAVDVLDPKGLRFVGHYDTRVVGKLSHPGQPYDVDADPSLDNGVDAAIIPYLRNELGWKSDAFYAGPFGGRWPTPVTPRGDWTSIRWNRAGGSPDRSQVLATSLRSAPQLRIFLASGYFDFSTPFVSSEYAISHLGLSPEARKRVELVRYQGGHAAYMTSTVRAEFSRDAAAFISGKTPAHQ